MPITCDQCGFTAQSNETDRCVLCKEPYRNRTKLAVKLSRDGISDVGPPSDLDAIEDRELRVKRAIRTRLLFKLIAVPTFLQGLVGIASIMMLLGIETYEVRLTLVGFVTGLRQDLTLPIASLGFFLRGIGGILGGILLWTGKPRGAIPSIGCWAFCVVIALIAVTEFPMLDFTIPAIARHLGSTVGKLAFGLPILWYLIARTRQLKKRTTMCNAKQSEPEA